MSPGLVPKRSSSPLVFRSLRDCGHHPSLILTGQHPIEAADYGFAGAPLRRLDFPDHSVPFQQAQLVGAMLRPLLAGIDLVIVQGDTTSVLAGATGARDAGVAIAHGEAGLRSHNPEAPRPEEGFRIAIDEMADLLFAPTEYSAANLRRERVAGIVHITGNNAVDALLTLRPGRQARISDRQVQRLLVTCHRRENWEHGISGIATALRRIAETKNVAIKLLLHPNPAIAQALRGWLSWHVPARGFEDRLRLAV